MVLSLGASGCVTGDKFTRLRPGMTKAEVVALLGQPKGYEQDGEYETLQYPGLTSGFSWDTANYSVTLRNGIVVKYGAGEVQKAPHNTVVIVPPIAPR
jgi:hypothetical protein